MVRTHVPHRISLETHESRQRVQEINQQLDVIREERRGMHPEFDVLNIETYDEATEILIDELLALKPIVAA